MNPAELFNLNGRVAVITGGAGLLGKQHARALASAGAIPVLADIPAASPEKAASILAEEIQSPVVGWKLDITDSKEIEAFRDELLSRYGKIDILINNAANNPKIESPVDTRFERLENFPLELWEKDIAVGLTGAFLCSKILGTEMAQQGRGVILNIASDLALISPDQRLYRQEGLAENQQPVKPITYSVIKTGLIGLTRYLATYWADRGVRVNALSPGGIYNSQPEEFVARLSQLIPLGRMAELGEYHGALLFLCSDASSYMTGANLVVDGGRTCW